MAQRPRLLLLGDVGPALSQLLLACSEHLETATVENDADALRLLTEEPTVGLVASPSSLSLRARLRQLLRAEQMLDALTDGVAVVDLQMRIVWANRTLQNWAKLPVEGRMVHEALGWPKELIEDRGPFRRALIHQTAFSCFQTRDHHFYELHVSPLDADGPPPTQLLTVCQDVTAERNRQRRLDALHQVASQLAPLTPDQLAEMSVDERVELLKHRVKSLTRDLLHYDVIEIRILDPATRRLEPLVSEGMLLESSDRCLVAEEEDNGVTGYVAATGKTYVCPDTSADPRYVEGAPGARSSLTVPLIDREELIGTLNVESPQLNAFSAEDVQFVEIFSREIAAALHTLDLLTAEKQSTTARAIDAVSREVALPVDEILAASASLLDKFVGHDEELATKLRTILHNARAIKWSIQKVGHDLAPSPMTRERDSHGPAPFEGMRILVADNDERVRRSAHGILGRWGCVVETARDGREALTMAKLSAYDTVLADIRLPDLSGYDAYCQLRQAQPEAQVILMTSFGYDPTHTLVKARQDGLRHVLYKPFRIDQLRDALSTAAES